MKLKALIGSLMAVALLGVGMLAGSVVGTGRAAAQVPAAAPAAAVAQAPAAAPAVAQAPAAVVAQAQAPAFRAVARVARGAVADTTPSAGQTTPKAPSGGSQGTIQAKITQAQAEQAALAANPGATVAHTHLYSDNGTAAYDVDFTNGGGAIVDANTGKVITSEAAGTDAHAGRGPHGGGGADQAALLAQAKVTQQQAEQTAVAANAGATVDHSRLGKDSDGTIFWDVDFTNGGGAIVNATTGAIIKNEAAGTDHGANGKPNGGTHTRPTGAPNGGPNGGRHGGRSAAATSAP